MARLVAVMPLLLAMACSAPRQSALPIGRERRTSTLHPDRRAELAFERSVIDIGTVDVGDPIYGEFYARNVSPAGGWVRVRYLNWVGTHRTCLFWVGPFEGFRVPASVNSARFYGRFDRQIELTVLPSCAGELCPHCLHPVETEFHETACGLLSFSGDGSEWCIRRKR